MKLLKRILSGDLNGREARRYVAFVSATFWGLIFLAWLGYPAENKYSIMTHTFSFLGSYETKHSPQWWWLFSLAMLFWGGAGIPLSLYYRRRFSAVSRRGAWAGAGLLIIGCLNIALVGVFPDAKTQLTETLRVTDVHEKVAIFAAAGFILGISWHGVLLLKDWLGKALFGGERQLAQRGMIAPYLFWITVLTVASYFLIKWEFVYAERKAAAQAAGVPIGSSWSEAMNTRYSFPLWENMLIYTLFIFLVWFAVSLSRTDTD
ncbi:MAG TPA: hypothetical protein ENN29_02830 [Candidatus Hydrogenedentes bacterium]|nr:hypothetical protein [Candidatus Hydrogenedentota bacterium]